MNLTDTGVLLGEGAQGGAEHVVAEAAGVLDHLLLAHAVMDATAEAHASGWPRRSSPPGNGRSSKVAAIAAR